MVDGRRIKVTATKPVNHQGQFVLYWMTAARRTRHNDALERAVEWAKELRKPLVVLEALSVDYPWASERHHQFIIDGMKANYEAFLQYDVAYFAYIEKSHREGRGLVLTLAQSSCVVITDYFPCFFLPRVTDAVARRVTCRMESVDANGVLPINGAGKAFTSAYNFRRYMQRHVIDALNHQSTPEPLESLGVAEGGRYHRERLVRCGVSSSVLSRWVPTDFDASHLRASKVIGPSLSTDVQALSLQGGQYQAHVRMTEFLSGGIHGYGTQRNDPRVRGTSGLSPYLHFGHLSSVEVVTSILERFNFSAESDSRNFKGQRSGFWELPEDVEGYLDQIITWRELGYGFCHFVPDYYEYQTLPPWALATLDEHRNDERPFLYTLEQFEYARTHDNLWNAAQNQLRRDGYIHNYLRMLWAKKILHWCQAPEEALSIMVHLNNKYALDGRNPNSYSGIFWTLGRFDRAWGPEREVFGKVRYMTSDSTARKFSVRDYVLTYQDADSLGLQLS